MNIQLPSYREEAKIEAFYGAMADGLIKVYNKLGKPPADVKDASFWIMIDQIIQVWDKMFPEEVKALIHDNELDKAVERSLGESVRKGFKASLVMPPKLFSLIKTIFPDLIVSGKEFKDKMVARYPFMNASNYT